MIEDDENALPSTIYDLVNLTKIKDFGDWKTQECRRTDEWKWCLSSADITIMSDNLSVLWMSYILDKQNETLCLMTFKKH